jgi:hypothetical protein
VSELNPLTGRPLEPWQQLIIGPAETWNAFDQGPRRTVVDGRPGAILPPWIVRLDIPIGSGASVTAFQDTGTPGGSYQPGRPQQLPELVTTAQLAPAMSWTTFLLLALAVVAFAAGRRG